MINWYKKVVFENYANFNGRASRSEFWYFVLMNLIISGVTTTIDMLLGLEIGFNAVYGLAVFIPGLAVAVRRLHDVGKSGWLLLVAYMLMIGSAIVLLVSAFMPNNNILGKSALIITFVAGIVALISVIWILILFCKSGDQGENKYGSDPKSDGSEGIEEIGQPNSI